MKKLDDQLKGLDVDLEERIVRKEKEPSIFETMTIQQSIIAAAVILVCGFWGFHYVDEYLERKRIEAAVIEATRMFEGLNRDMRESSLRMQREQRQRQEAIKNAQAEREQQRVLREEQSRQEARLMTDQCRFWVTQMEQEPNRRNFERRQQACGY